MATLDGNLWMYNLTRVRVVDVSDDYRLMQPSMPSDFYPVLTETWLPTFGLQRRLEGLSLYAGYLYDWHEPGEEIWTVGVVAEELASKDWTPGEPGATDSPTRGSKPGFGFDATSLT